MARGWQFSGIKNMIKIRKAKIQDLDSIKRILATKELGMNSPERFVNYVKRLIKNDEGIFLVAEHMFNVVGIIYGESDTKENWAEISGIAILENYRMRGIGSQLIKEFEKIVYNKNINNIELYAHVNTLAKYIHKFGYKRGFVYIHYIKKLE